MKVTLDFSKISSLKDAIDFSKIKKKLSLLSPFRIISKRCLGIDVGTSSVRIVEMSSLGERKKLERFLQGTVSKL